jgi:hypothetical protein
MALYSQNQHQPGTSDCPVVHRTVSGALGWLGGGLPALGNLRGVVAKIHRTVRWCTGLSGESEPPEPTVGSVISGRHVAWANDQWAHQTVCAKRSESATVGFARKGRRSDTEQALIMSGGAPDCLVRHPTESKDCLPKGIPTAPRPLGPIKGTPMRLQQRHKCSQQLYTSFGSILSSSRVYLSSLCRGKAINL